MLVDTMNRCWAQPLVEARPGRSPRSGASVTSFGLAVLAHYHALQDSIATAALCPDRDALARAILPSPRPARKD